MLSFDPSFFTVYSFTILLHSPSPWPDENRGRMKEARGRMIIKELASRTMKVVVENRDKQGRRGRAARHSASAVGHAGITSPQQAKLNIRGRPTGKESASAWMLWCE